MEFKSLSNTFYPSSSKLFTLKSLYLSDGYLSYTNKESSNGHYIQHLSGKNFENDKMYYMPNAKWRNSILWEFNPCDDEEGEYFLLTNKGLDFGYLAISEVESNHGFYVEHLFSKGYDNKKKEYEKGGKMRDGVLWKIVQGEDGSHFIISKRYEKNNEGLLSFADTKAASGFYGQICCENKFNEDRMFYEVGGKWRKSILWEIKEAVKK